MVVSQDIYALFTPPSRSRIHLKFTLDYLTISAILYPFTYRLCKLQCEIESSVVGYFRCVV